MSFSNYLVITQVIQEDIILFQIWNTAEKSEVFSKYYSQILVPSHCLSIPNGIIVVILVYIFPDEIL